MSARQRAFSGRIVFDHLAKTAGQAVNAWLIDALGTGCVTPNLIGDHLDLIRRHGGTHSVISAHLSFQGEGLEPRYHYMTLVREPTDRALSWLFFLIHNHESQQLPGLWQAAERFIASEGTELSDELRGHIQNPYVEHFCRVSNNGPLTNDRKLAEALASIGQYDVWGLYEEMPAFLADVGSLIKVPAPDEIGRVNVTRERPAVDRISPLLRDRLAALNELDLAFYDALRAMRKPSAPAARSRKAAGEPAGKPAAKAVAWLPYNPVRERQFTAPVFTLLSATIEPAAPVMQGQILQFQLEFSLARGVDELEIGIHILDETDRRAFGINTTRLGRTLRQVRRGMHRVRFTLVAQLPEGPYTAGFALADKGGGGLLELAWYDRLIAFHVNAPRLHDSVGYASLAVETEYTQISTAVAQGAVGCFRAGDPRLFTVVGQRIGMALHSTGKEGFLLYGPYLPLSAGRFVARLRLRAVDAGGLWIDVSAKDGSQVLARLDCSAADESSDVALLHFALEEPVSDLEVRVWVPATASVQLDSLWILPAWDGADA